MVIYNIQGKITSKRNGLPVPYAKIEILEVDKVGVNYSTIVIANGLSGMDGDFSINFDFPIPLPSRPDIIFRISQNVDGIIKYIYNENPSEDTRWNVADVLYADIEIEEDCVTINSPSSSVPYDHLFVFTRVGLIPTANIDQADGYAYSDITPSPPNSMDTNIPFGRTLDIAGWFGMFCDVEYYKIQYSSNGVVWNDISDPLYNNWYDVTNQKWVTESMGPETISGVSNLYKLPRRDLPWTFPDLLVRWDTTKVTDGLYTLKILGKKKVAGTIVDSVHLTIDPSYGTIKLQTDNSTPKCEIKEIWHNATKVEACTMVQFTSGTIKVIFEASDAKGYMRMYSLNALYGHSQVVVPTPAPPISPDKAVDDCSNHIGPTKKWNGGIYTVEYPASEYDSVEMPPCAYEFRLRVDKRTNNGYGLVYWGYEDNVHITIQR